MVNKERILEVIIPAEMSAKKAAMYTEAFIGQMHRNLINSILTIHWEMPPTGNNLIIHAILNHDQGVNCPWLEIPNVENKLSIEVMEAFQKFTWRIKNIVKEPNIDEVQTTLVYKQAKTPTCWLSV